MSKDEQIKKTMEWLDTLYLACEQVIYETDVDSIEPFELVSLINVRLHMEEITGKQKKTPKSKNNLVVFPGKKNDDTH